MSVPFSDVNLNNIKNDIRTNSNTAVRKTGDQTIQGIKTFSDKMILGSSGIQFSDATALTTAPSGGARPAFFMRDRTTIFTTGVPPNQKIQFNDDLFTPVGVVITDNVDGTGATSGTQVTITIAGYYQINCSMVMDTRTTLGISPTPARMDYKVVRQTSGGSLTTVAQAIQTGLDFGTGGDSLSVNVSSVAKLDVDDILFVKMMSTNTTLRGLSSDQPITSFSGCLIAEA